MGEVRGALSELSPAVEKLGHASSSHGAAVDATTRQLQKVTERLETAEDTALKASRDAEDEERRLQRAAEDEARLSKRKAEDDAVAKRRREEDSHT